MFASILDRFPGRSALQGEEFLEPALRAQFDAGVGILSDGVVWDGSASTEAIDRAVAAWGAAWEIGRALARVETPQIEAPLVKVCLLGPWSAIVASGGSTSARETGRRVREAIDALFQAGASIVQLVEDALAQLDPNDAVAVAASREALDAATRSARGHVSLSVGGGAVDRLGDAFFFDLPVASFAFDLINGPDNWRLIARAPQDRGILCGVADCRTAGDDEEAVMIWAARYAASTGERGLERVGLCTSSGLQTLSFEAAARKLAGLGSAARKAGLPPSELASSIDPRAVDARSAALGGYDPAQRRSR